MDGSTAGSSGVGEASQVNLTDKQSGQSQKSRPRIQRAPPALRDVKYFEQNLEPKVYSFGPIHHGKGKFQQGEEMKRKLAAEFIKDYNLDEDSLYEKISKQIQSFKDCYEKEVIENYDDQKLSRMLFVDGCALLFYLICCTSHDLYKLRTHRFTAALSHNDLFLLENQLPYGVLGILMEGAQIGKGLSLLMDEFVTSQWPPVDDHKKKRTNNKSIEGEWKPHHLLELLWMKVRFPEWNWSEKMLQQGDDVRGSKTSNTKPISQSHGVTILNFPSYSARDLIENGIRLNPSVSMSPKDICFRTQGDYPCLKLPSTIVDESTTVKLSNLVAYEMCPDFENDFEITTFICFLNSLIADTEDVAELISRRILVNLLSDREQVFNMFREIANKLVPNPYIYNNVQWNIQNFFDRMSRFQIWKNVLRREYLTTPGKMIAYTITLFSIYITVIQTVFTVLSYQKQK